MPEQRVAGEGRIAAEHFDQHRAGHVFAQRIFDEQFLRPFDVVADVGHVDAGAADRQPVVHLHRFQFQNPRAGHVAQQNVLSHLRVRPGGRSGGIAGQLAMKVDRQIARRSRPERTSDGAAA